MNTQTANTQSLDTLTKSGSAFSTYQELLAAMKAGYVPSFPAEGPMARNREAVARRTLGHAIEAIGHRVSWI